MSSKKLIVVSSIKSESFLIFLPKILRLILRGLDICCIYLLIFEVRGLILVSGGPGGKVKRFTS